MRDCDSLSVSRQVDGAAVTSYGESRARDCLNLSETSPIIRICTAGGRMARRCAVCGAQIRKLRQNNRRIRQANFRRFSYHCTCLKKRIPVRSGDAGMSVARPADAAGVAAGNRCKRLRTAIRIFVHRASRGRLASVACRCASGASAPTDPAWPASVPSHWPGRHMSVGTRQRVCASRRPTAQGNPDKWTNFNRFGHS